MSKVNELTLEFDEKALYLDLVELMVKAINLMSVHLLNIFKSEVQTKMKYAGIHAFWMYAVEQGTDTIVSYVGNYHWEAFLTNYGTGSLMDLDNPWLEEYKASGYYNSERDNYGGAVLSRPKGEYKIPNFPVGIGDKTRRGGGQVNSDGSPKNLEQEFGTNGVAFQKFKPEYPQNWLENGMDKFGIMFEDAINDALDSFDWSSDRYLKGGG